MEKNKIKSIYSLTPMQEGMLYHSLVNPDDNSYHLQMSMWVSNKIELTKIKEALNLLAKKHETLRTSFVIPKKTGKSWQVILEDRVLELIYVKKYGAKEEDVVKEIEEYDLKRGFDLQNDSLIRLTIFTLSENKHLFLFSFHHIIMDGWCISTVFGDFLRYYRQLEDGTSMSDMERIVGEEKKMLAEYSEYIKWQENRDKEEGLKYWKELLLEYEEPAEIKATKRPEYTDVQMDRIRVSLEKELSQRLNKIALANNVTINTVMEAAWGIVLQSYNRTNDVVFGKVVSGRDAKIKGIEQTVGLFINTIPVRVKREADMTVVELLRELQKQGIEGSSYDYCSLAEVQNQTKLGSNLIKTLFIFENYYIDKERLQSDENGLQIEMESAREQTNYPVNITAHFDGEKLSYDIMYNPNKYEKEEAQSILERLKIVLQDMSLNPEKKLIEIEKMTEEEKALIIGEFNDTYHVYPRDKTVAELFEEQVEKTPNQIAVTFEDDEITYREFNKKTNALAHKLRNLGIKPGDYVAIMTERS
ncbi:condensation domain-containing protein, partial [Bacillus thuringiensis]|uniref:condensation domain-containing protein n=1 Tax=Bacillus thuringiensis TaxID=1428 RepID=UPI002FBDE5E1